MGRLNIQAAGGVEMRVAQHLYVTGEYALTRTVQDVSVPDGTARTPLTTHHVAAGMALKLGAGPAGNRAK